jgi:signal peptidase II
MANQDQPRVRWLRDAAFVFIVLLVIAADQFTKYLIAANLEIGEVVFDNWLFRIIYITNTGAAFGMLKGGLVFLIIVDFIGIAVILCAVFFLRKRWPFLDHWSVRAGLALILAGTIGNLIDRMFIGHVTDFVDLRWWPVWNIADASVTVGVIILVYCLLFLSGWMKSK